MQGLPGGGGDFRVDIGLRLVAGEPLHPEAAPVVGKPVGHRACRAAAVSYVNLIVGARVAGILTEI